jgi:hypothetical protein
MGRGRGCSVTMLGLCGIVANAPLARGPFSDPQIVHGRLLRGPSDCEKLSRHATGIAELLRNPPGVDLDGARDAGLPN